VVYNASKVSVMQLHGADAYPVRCDVVGVTICNFNLWPEQDERGRFKVPMLSRWRMQEQHSGERGLPQVQACTLGIGTALFSVFPRQLHSRWSVDHGR